VIKVFLDKVQEKALGLKVGEGLNPSQAFIKLVESELTQIIGGENKTLDPTFKPKAFSCTLSRNTLITSSATSASNKARRT
jgi:signal recognition particle GTPase